MFYHILSSIVCTSQKRLALAARLNGNEAAQEQPDNLPAQVSGVSGLRDYRAQLLNST